MNDKQTRILAVRGNRIVVAIESTEGCAGCRSKSACGSVGTRELEVPPEVAARLRVGDFVSLSLADGATLRAVAMAYGLPLTGFLTGFGVASAWGIGDGWTMLSGVTGLLAGFAVARLVSRRMRMSLQPEVRVLGCR